MTQPTMTQSNGEVEVKYDFGKLNSRIQALENRLALYDDERAITLLLYKYWRTLDDAVESNKDEDWNAYIDLNTDDVEFNHPGAQAIGKSNAMRWAKSMTTEADPPIACGVRIGTNIEIEVNGDEASARANLHMAHVYVGGNDKDHLDEGGPYTWRFRRAPETLEGWRICYNGLKVVWTLGRGTAM